MLVIDVSGSMQAEDVDPTRLEAAQEVVREFLKGLPKRFQVGVVAFSETPRSPRPDRGPALAIDAIDYLYPQRGTAIGDGIARGVEVARPPTAGRGAASGRPRSCSSRRLADRGSCCRSRARHGRSRSGSRSTRSRSAPEGVVEFNASAGRGSSRAARPADAAADRRDDGRPSRRGEGGA